MTTTETFTHFDSTAARIDRLTGQVAVSAVGVGPDMVDALITDALRRVCELLAADVATLESLAEDTMNPLSRHSFPPWTTRTPSYRKRLPPHWLKSELRPRTHLAVY